MSVTRGLQTSGRYSDPTSEQTSGRCCDAEGREQRVEGRGQRVEVNHEAPRFARHLVSNPPVTSRCGSGKLEFCSQPQTARAAVWPDAGEPDLPRIWSARLTRETSKADDRALHTLLAFAATPQPDEPRLLWSRPSRDRVIVQGMRLEVRAIPGVFESCQGGDPIRLMHEPGVHLQLSVIGNPVQRHGSQATPLPSEAWGSWLLSRLAGVDVGHLECQRMPASRSNRPGGCATLARVAYTATVTVTDPAGLARCLVSGIGRGRAYGCGLVVARELS